MTREPVASLLAENEHGFYCVPLESRSRPAAQRVLSGDVWEPGTLALLMAAAADGDVVTAGAYFGDMLPGAAAAATSSTVWAFEPNPVNFRCASWTVRLNRATNVRLFRAALGQERATTEIVVGDHRGHALGGISHIAGSAPVTRPSLVERLRRRPAATAPCDVVRLDDVLDVDRRLALIHLDVERFEAPAVLGALGLIARWRPTLVLESAVDDTEAWPALADAGYELNDRVDGNRIYRASSAS